MDAIDILGGLLGRKAGGSGTGGSGGGGLPDILKEILNSATSQEPRRPADSRAAPTPSSRAAPTPSSIEQQARELEDLLNVTRERDANRRSAPAQQPKPTPRQSETAPAAPTDNPFAPPRTGRAPANPETGRPSQNDQALVLVRAMVNAAKADGQISPAEQQSILQQFETGTPEAIGFLRSELTRPLDVREFAWSVPLGMEQQVYAMSLIAIDVDSDAERDYLSELGHGLRLPAEAREAIQQRYGGARRR